MLQQLLLFLPVALATMTNMNHTTSDTISTITTSAASMHHSTAAVTTVSESPVKSDGSSHPTIPPAVSTVTMTLIPTTSNTPVLFPSPKISATIVQGICALIFTRFITSCKGRM